MVPAPNFHLSRLRCGAAGVRRFERSELGGLRRQQRIATTWTWALRRVLALIFQIRGLVLFIPWRLAAERGADFHIYRLAAAPARSAALRYGVELSEWRSQPP